MKLWSAFRNVPPIAPEALAWAVVSFATYLAALETAPQIAGQTVAPLALAVAVQFTLMLTRAIGSQKFALALPMAPFMAALLLMGCVAGIGALAAFGSNAIAAQLMIIWMLVNALSLTWADAHDPDSLSSMPSGWLHLDKHRERAVLIEACGFLVSAATLLWIWTFAGPIAFAAMMGFGVIYVRLATNWVIALSLPETTDSETDPSE